MTLNTGISQRQITQMGQDVTLTTESASVDHTTDWDDESFTTETDTVKALVDTHRSSDVQRNEVTRGASGERIVFVRSDISHTIKDGTGDSEPTVVTINSVDYQVVQFEDRQNGVIRMEVTRT